MDVFTRLRIITLIVTFQFFAFGLKGQWKQALRIIGLHDTSFSAIREPFKIRTYGDSGVSIFGAAYHYGPTWSFSKGIEADVNPADGSFIRSSAPAGLPAINGRFSKVAFSFPNQNRVVLHNRIMGNASQVDSILIRETTTDSTIVSFEGNWQVVNHQETSLNPFAWLYRSDSSLICKQINLIDGSIAQIIDLSSVLNDSLFGDKSNNYSLKNIVIDGPNLISEFTRANPGFIDPITGSYFFEQATISIDTSSLNISDSKYAKVPSKEVGVLNSGESETIIYIDEISVKHVADTTVRRSLFLYDFINNQSVSISYRTKYYINILGYETIPGNLIYTQNGFYLMYTPIYNFPSNGRVLDGIRLALFDSTGNVIYDVETDNEWLNLYFNQVRISKSGEVYFNIQEERPSDNIILGKIDLNGNNPLFKKSLLSTTEVIPTPGDLISIYPNPATSYIEISSDSTLEEANIVNCLGELVYAVKIKGNRHLLNTMDYARGIYFLTIRSKEGRVSTSKVLLN